LLLPVIFVYPDFNVIIVKFERREIFDMASNWENYETERFIIS